jgi:hypothetical protein
MNNKEKSTDLVFERTSIAFPEQYCVFQNDLHVAYIRLRGGQLYAECPDIDGETVYEHQFENKSKGCFENDEERDKYLKEIGYQIVKWLDENPNGGIPEIMSCCYNQLIEDLKQER